MVHWLPQNIYVIMIRLIITHIDTIKEAFDNKMFVTKDPILGSKVSKI